MKRLLIFVPLLCGCSFAHEKMVDQLAGIARETAARLGESGTGQVAAGGSVINPGVEVSAGVTYSASARYVGVAGQITASMQGDLSREVPANVQANIERIYADSALSAAEKFAAAMAMLREWSAGREPATEPTP